MARPVNRDQSRLFPNTRLTSELATNQIAYFLEELLGLALRFILARPAFRSVLGF